MGGAQRTERTDPQEARPSVERSSTADTERGGNEPRALIPELDNAGQVFDTPQPREFDAGTRADPSGDRGRGGAADPGSAEGDGARRSGVIRGPTTPLAEWSAVQAMGESGEGGRPARLDLFV